MSAAANGGTAAYIRSLGSELSRKGWKVEGVSRVRQNTGHTLSHQQSDATGEENADTLSIDNWKTRLVTPDGPARFVLPHVLSLITRPVLRDFGIALYKSSYRKSLTRNLSPENDVVHYVGTGWELFGMAALEIARRRRAVFTVTPFVHPSVWGDSAIDVRFYNAADAVFVCSDFEREHLIKKGVRKDILTKTGMAPAAQCLGSGLRFRQRHRLGERPLILFLARKQEYKGYHVLRAAIDLIRQDFPDVCLLAAGADMEPPYPTLPDANVLDLGELGSSPEDLQEKSDALAACDVFCMPSRAEAFGIAYAEAWFHAKPVVGGPAPALKEIILDGINGYRVEQDAGQIAAILSNLLRDPILRERLGKNGYAFQQQHFTWDVVVREHEKIWRRLMNRTPQGAL